MIQKQSRTPITSPPLPERENDNRGVTGLAAGTLVTTPDGDKPIEEIQAGDMVLSGFGGRQTQFYNVGKVSAKQYSGPMLTITSKRSASRLRVTPNHICFCKSKNFNSHSEDTINLRAFTGVNGDLWRHITFRVKSQEKASKFKNFDYAEESARKMSQSCGGLEIKRYAIFGNQEHHFMFMPSTDLEIGMKLPILENWKVVHSLITNITEEHYDGLVYDLDIPDARNFAANGVLVHDSTSISL
jgi:hypothetical protein